MTVEQFFSDCTPEQRRAMYEVHSRPSTKQTWAEFLESAYAPAGTIAPYVGIPDWCGMFLGIEPDGYTHS